MLTPCTRPSGTIYKLALTAAILLLFGSFGVQSEVARFRVSAAPSPFGGVSEPITVFTDNTGAAVVVQPRRPPRRYAVVLLNEYPWQVTDAGTVFGDGTDAQGHYQFFRAPNYDLDSTSSQRQTISGDSLALYQMNAAGDVVGTTYPGYVDSLDAMLGRMPTLWRSDGSVSYSNLTPAVNETWRKFQRRWENQGPPFGDPDWVHITDFDFNDNHTRAGGEGYHVDDGGTVYGVGLHGFYAVRYVINRPDKGQDGELLYDSSVSNAFVRTNGFAGATWLGTSSTGSSLDISHDPIVLNDDPNHPGALYLWLQIPALFSHADPNSPGQLKTYYPLHGADYTRWPVGGTDWDAVQAHWELNGTVTTVEMVSGGGASATHKLVKTQALDQYGASPQSLQWSLDGVGFSLVSGEVDAINRDGWALVNNAGKMELWRGAGGLKTPVIPLGIGQPAMNKRSVSLTGADGSVTSYPSPQIVGFYSDGLTRTAVLIEENITAQQYELFDLNQIATVPPGWHLEKATDINAQGVIAALVKSTTTQDSKGAILLPVEMQLSPHQISSGLGTVTLTADVRQQSGQTGAMEGVTDGAVVRFTVTDTNGATQIFTATTVNGVATLLFTRQPSVNYTVQADVLSATFGGQLVNFADGSMRDNSLVKWNGVRFPMPMTDASGTRYLKLGLDGWPQPDERPQLHAEQRNEPEESFIDALNLHLHHAVTDAYAPLVGGELELAVRRNLASEVWRSDQGLWIWERPDRPFGVNWQTNLGASIEFIYQRDPIPNFDTDADYAYVTDEQGVQYRFLVVGSNFYPLPQSNHEVSVYESTLTAQGGGYAFTKKNGSAYYFESTGVTFDIPVDRLRPASIGKRHAVHQFARLKTITDRFGLSLTYDYDGGNTLVPYDITSSTGQTIWIQSNNGLVASIYDPLGRQTTYEYESRTYKDPTNVAQTFWVLTRVNRPSDAQTPASTTQYRYEMTSEKDTIPPIQERYSYQTNLTAIMDGEGQVHEFVYSWDHSRQTYVPSQGFFIQTGVPRYVSVSRLPGGLGVAQFVNQSLMKFTTADDPQFAGTRSTQVTDAAGGVHHYTFTGNKVVRLNAVKPLYGDGRNIPDWLVPHMVVFTQMDVDRAGLGTESYHFDLTAGLQPDWVSDLSGNVTQFEYGDAFNYTAYHPGLPGGFPVEKYPEPTAQTDALGQRRTMTYGPYRQIATQTDEEGRRHVFGFGPQGQRTSEQVFGADGALVQTAAWTYGDPRFPSFSTRMTRAEANPAPGAATLASEFVADAYGYVGQEIRDADDSRWSVWHTYDVAGQRIRTADGNGFSTSFIYDAQARLLEVDYPSTDGNPAHFAHRAFAYDRRGQKVSEVDENGNAMLWNHDALGRVIAEGHDLNGNGLLDAGDPLTRRTYNTVGSVTEIYDALGNLTKTTYDTLQRPLQITDSLGKFTQFSYGANSGGAIWDSSGFHPTQTIDRRGYRTIRVYDARYRLTSESQEYEAGKFAQRTSGYDHTGLLTSETDARGNPSTHRYDGLSRRISTTFADGTTQRWSYGPSGELVASTEERGFTTQTYRDGAGRVRSVVGPPIPGGQARLSSSYDAAGNLATTRLAIAAGQDRVTSWTYDARNRRTVEQRADGTTLGWTYDDGGRAVAERDARGFVTEKSYDAANRLVAVTGPTVALPDGGTARMRSETTYDAAGNVLTTRSLVRPGQWRGVVNTYDALNRLATTTDEAAQTTAYGYDSEGHRMTVTDALLHTTRFRYDGLGRVTQETDPAGRFTTHGFDGAVELRRTDAEGRVTNYAYDTRLRLTTTSYVGAPADDRTYAYDAAGHLTGVTIAGHGGLCNVAYAYDAAARVTTEASSGLTHTYAYDLAGQRVQTTLGTGRATVPTYDPLGRLASLTESGRTTSYGYDGNGNPVRETLPGSGGEITRTYDALNRVVSISGPSYTASHAYTLTGELVSLVETHPDQPSLNRTVANGYDAIARLISETITGAGAGVTTYAYDAANNRTRRERPGDVTTYAYNALNQLTTQTSSLGGGASYTYDLGGNRTARTSTLPDQPSATYAYDYDHRLTGIATNAGGQALSLAYFYDYRTRRVGRTEQGQGTSVVFSGGLSVAEYASGAAVPAVEYQRGPDLGGGVGGLLYSLRGGQPSFAYEDHRGDVIARRDATGTATWAANYEAFGQRPLELGTDPDKMRANTKEEDSAGLLDEGFRYRDLATGTFMTRDPAGFADGPNLYTYCGQNPWSKFDPEGLSVMSTIFGTENLSEFGRNWVSTSGAIGKDIYNFGNGVTDAFVATGAGIGNFAGRASVEKGKVVTEVVNAVEHEINRGADFLGEASVNPGGVTSRTVAKISQGVTDWANNPDAVAGQMAKVAVGVELTLVGNAGTGMLKSGANAAKDAIQEAMAGAKAEAKAAARGVQGVCFLKGTEIATGEGQRAIESLRVGERVLTTDGDSTTEVSPAVWRKITLKMPNPECPSDTLDLELLRSRKWMEAVGCEVGARIWFELEEMGLQGWVEVQSIADCPPIGAGRGRVILATVTHFNSFVMEVKLEGQSEGLHPTDRHRLFSTTRNEWVATSMLRPGEELRTADNKLRIASIQSLPGTHRVYNIEVETEHSYFAGKAKVLSHNANPCSASRPGNRGHPDHQADVQGPGRAQAEAQARPGETVLSEQPVQGHPGVNRRADNQIVGADGRTRLTVESERRPNGPYHKKRVEQLEGVGIEVQTRPIPQRKQ